MPVNERGSYASNERAEPRDSETYLSGRQKKDIFTSFGGGEFDRRHGGNPTLSEAERQTNQTQYTF